MDRDAITGPGVVARLFVCGIALLVGGAGCNSATTPATQPFNPYGTPNFDVAPCIDYDTIDGSTGPKSDVGAASDTQSDVLSADAGAATDATAADDSVVLPKDVVLTDANDAANADATGDGSGGEDDGSSGSDAIPADAADGETGADADAVTTDVPSGPPTFGVVWDNVIAKYGCSSSLCHGAQAGDMAYFANKATAYALIVNKASKVPSCQFLPIVFPGKPDTSVLYTKMKDGAKTCGDKMPIGSDGLPDSITNVVKEWIAAGAPK